MNKLPQHILDIISQFNPDHRDQMNNVFEDIIARENVCDGCYEPILLQEEKKVARILGKKYVFCGSWCKSDGEEFIRECYYRKLNENK